MTPSQGGVAQAKPSIAGRTYPAIHAASTRPLYLAGGIVGDPAGAVTAAFRADAGGAGARIVVVAAGYKAAVARADAKAIAAALAPTVASVSWTVVDGTLDSAEAAAIAGATGVVLTGQDRSQIGAALAGSAEWLAIRNGFAAGSFALLADDAAAAAMGSTYVAKAVPADVEAGAIADPIGTPPLATGWGLASNVSVQPGLLPGQYWPQLFQLARAEPADIALGIDVGTAIRIAGAGAPTVVGSSAVVAIDSSRATFATGTNDAIGASWLLVDTFAAGDAVTP